MTIFCKDIKSINVMIRINLHFNCDWLFVIKGFVWCGWKHMLLQLGTVSSTFPFYFLAKKRLRLLLLLTQFFFFRAFFFNVDIPRKKQYWKLHGHFFFFLFFSEIDSDAIIITCNINNINVLLLIVAKGILDFSNVTSDFRCIKKLIMFRVHGIIGYCRYPMMVIWYWFLLFDLSDISRRKHGVPA
jgi:hypothetical protein